MTKPILKEKITKRAAEMSEEFHRYVLDAHRSTDIVNIHVLWDNKVCVEIMEELDVSGSTQRALRMTTQVYETEIPEDEYDERTSINFLEAVRDEIQTKYPRVLVRIL